MSVVVCFEPNGNTRVGLVDRKRLEIKSLNDLRVLEAFYSGIREKPEKLKIVEMILRLRNKYDLDDRAHQPTLQGLMLLEDLFLSIDPENDVEKYLKKIIEDEIIKMILHLRSENRIEKYRFTFEWIGNLCMGISRVSAREFLPSLLDEPKHWFSVGNEQELAKLREYPEFSNAYRSYIEICAFENRKRNGQTIIFPPMSASLKQLRQNVYVGILSPEEMKSYEKFQFFAPFNTRSESKDEWNIHTYRPKICRDFQIHPLKFQDLRVFEIINWLENQKISTPSGQIPKLQPLERSARTLDQLKIEKKTLIPEPVMGQLIPKIPAEFEQGANTVRSFALDRKLFEELYHIDRLRLHHWVSSVQSEPVARAILNSARAKVDREKAMRDPTLRVEDIEDRYG